MQFISIFIGIITILNACSCLEPITLTTTFASVGVSVGFAGYKYLYCNYYECCDKPWINYDLFGLEQDMKNNLFGQHLVHSIVLKSIKAHLEKKNPNKALVLSFHGGTGVGKNHVSKMIMKSLYKEGSKSKYVHLYIGTQHFPHKAEHDIVKYRTFLQKDIEMKAKACERSLFVFDEVDKMAPTILDILNPYLDHHENVDGVDYRKNIFIFLSNAGTTNISQIALKFWMEGINREDITLKNMEHLIGRGAYNEAGGLQYSDVIRKELIDAYVPFLPLEKKHVKQCIQSTLLNRRYRTRQTIDADAEDIANQLLYTPPKIEVFSVNGCKKVDQKVDLYLY